MKKRSICSYIIKGNNMSLTRKKGIWKDGNDGRPGDTLEASISKSQVTISNHCLWNGTYPRMYNDNIHGRDGKTYYSYDAGFEDSHHSYFLLDRNLLYPKRKGLLKLRSRGEGFFEQKFTCSDADKPLDVASSDKTVKRHKR